MNMLRMEFSDGIAVLRMANGDKNPIGPRMVQELSEAVGMVRDDPRARGIVLASAGQRYFSLGLDLPNIIDLARVDFEVFFQAYNRLCTDLYSLPKPTAAAIGGHAIAGGCILALCCDHRFVAEGKVLIGVNEVKLGVPLPYHAQRILAQIVGDRTAMRMAESGEFIVPEDAMAIGLADAVLPADQVVGAAVEAVRRLAALPEDAFALTKMNRTEPVLRDVAENAPAKDQRFVECWYSDATQERLRKAMERF